MMHQKQEIWRSRTYLDAAAGKQCVRCGAQNGTTVPAHYTGLRQHTYGKGYGEKCSDITTADLCMSCHTYFDQPQQRKSVEASEDFLHCIVLTVLRRLRDKVLVIK